MDARTPLDGDNVMGFSMPFIERLSDIPGSEHNLYMCNPMQDKSAYQRHHIDKAISLKNLLMKNGLELWLLTVELEGKRGRGDIAEMASLDTPSDISTNHISSLCRTVDIPI
jgi:hypothetical protein